MTTGTSFMLLVFATPTCSNHIFTNPLSYVTTANPTSVATGDFNGDGNTDLVTANYEVKNVFMLLNDGVGGFKPVVNFAAGTNPKYVVVGNFKGTGKGDVALANYWVNRIITLTGGCVEPTIAR